MLTPVINHRTIAVQGCGRLNCDCDVHTRDWHVPRQTERKTPSEPVRIYWDWPREDAKRDYAKLFPYAVKVIYAYV